MAVAGRTPTKRSALLHIAVTGTPGTGGNFIRTTGQGLGFIHHNEISPEVLGRAVTKKTLLFPPVSCAHEVVGVRCQSLDPFEAHPRPALPPTVQVRAMTDTRILSTQHFGQVGIAFSATFSMPRIERTASPDPLGVGDWL